MSLGFKVGRTVGAGVGIIVGGRVGRQVGLGVGDRIGLAVGTVDGDAVTIPPITFSSCEWEAMVKYLWKSDGKTR